LTEAGTTARWTDGRTDGADAAVAATEDDKALATSESACDAGGRLPTAMLLWNRFRYAWRNNFVEFKLRHLYLFS